MKRLLALLTLLVTLPVWAGFFDTTWDWEAHKFQTNVVASGGSLSSTSYLASVRFINHSRQWGVRQLLRRVNLYMGSNTNACTSAFIWDWTGTEINDDLIAFAAADYTEATGLTGNGTTKYLRVSKAGGLALSAVANGTNIHLSTYVRTGSNEASDCSGVSDAGTGTAYALAISNGGNTYVFMGSGTQNAVNTNAIGFFLSTRSATTNATTYQNTTNIVTDTTANTVTLPPEAYMMHAINVDGAVVAHTSRTLSFYGLGAAVPPAFVKPYNDCVQAVQRALGRNVP